MIYKVIAFIALIGFASALNEKIYQKAFRSYMKRHNKVYESDEFEHRYNAFKGNYDFVQNWNGEFEVGLNVFADLTNEEFNSMYKGYKGVHAEPNPRPEDLIPRTTLPDLVNWTAAGAVTPIKNQGQCGSCWSFSATGGIEGCHQIATKNLVSFSEQNLIDCSVPEGDQGCNGGLMDDAFTYVIKNKGLDTESSYPYQTAGPLKCRYNPANSGGTITSYTDIPSGSEPQLEAAIVNAPVSVAIDASLQSFQLYTSGVYYAPGCSSQNLDHGVLAVGFGTDSSSGKEYYIVKNSWGTSWGMEGYIWMSRNRNNNCGIATAASFPTGCQ